MKLGFEAVTMVGFNIRVLQYAEPNLLLEELKMESPSPAKLDCLPIYQPTFRHILEDSALICV